MTTDIKTGFCNADIPLEQQVVFLRQRALTMQFDMYEILDERFGSAGREAFKALMMRSYRRAAEMLAGLDFQTIAGLLPVSDNMLGITSATDYRNADEARYSISYCPYLEECKKRGLDMQFCEIMEEAGIQEVSRTIGEFTEPRRMCRGDSTCTFIMRNTLGR